MKKKTKKFPSCYIISETSLGIQCAEVLLKRNYCLLAIISSNPDTAVWAIKNNIPYLPSIQEFESKYSSNPKPFDYLFSIVNSNIIPLKLLTLPRYYAINYHDAPLPKYAGMYATSWAILNNEKYHGVSWHIMEKKIDAGNILSQVTFEIEDDETAFTLNLKCYTYALNTFKELIKKLKKGPLIGIIQDLNKRSYFSLHQKPYNFGFTSFSSKAEEIYKVYRALKFGNYSNSLASFKIQIGQQIYVPDNLIVLPIKTKFVPGFIVKITEKEIQITTNTQDILLSNFKNLMNEEVSVKNIVSNAGICEGHQLNNHLSNKLINLLKGSNEIFISENFWKDKLFSISETQLKFIEDSVLYNLKQLDYKEDISTLYTWKYQEDYRCIQDKQNISYADILIASFLVYLHKFCCLSQFTVGFITTFLSSLSKEKKIIFSPHVPLTSFINRDLTSNTMVEHICKEIADLERNKAYIKDVFVRYPNLKVSHPISKIIIHKGNYKKIIDLLEEDSLLFYVDPEDKSYGLYSKNCYYDNVNQVIIQNFSNHINNILNQIIEHPEKKLDKVSILSEKEKLQILQNDNSSNKEYTANKMIHVLFEEQAEKTPDNIAIVYDDNKLTYRSLNHKANQLAHYLRQTHTIKPDTLIALCLDRSEYMIIAILGILKAGGAYVPIDPSYPDDRIQYILADINTEIIITNIVHKQRLKRLRKKINNNFLNSDKIQYSLQPNIIVLDSQELQKQLLSEKTTNQQIKTISNNLAYVIYTSGTTGNPKGVLQLHRNVERLFAATNDWYNFNNNDVWTLFHSYSFDFSVWEIWGALIYGGKLIILSYENTRDLNIFYNICKREKVTVLNQTPSAFYQFIDIAINQDIKNQLTNLRYVIFGGEALNLSQLKPWFDYYGYNQPKLINMYGITETTVHVTYKVIEEEDLGNSSHIGKIIPDLKAYVLDTSLTLLPIGAIGELYVGGAGLARGYLNKPELTEERFITNPFQTKKEKILSKNTKLYKTGDLVRWLPNFNLEYVGRNDFQVKIRGFRIELGEIENALSSYEGIRQSVVVVKEHIDKGLTTSNKYLVGYYTAENIIDEESILNYLNSTLPEYMVPSKLVYLKNLPLTINGKLDSRALPEPEFTSTDNYVEPSNQVENRLCKIWSDVLNLNLEKVGIQDDFFRLGGDSILAIRLVSRINKVFSTQVKVIDIFELRCIFNLAKLITVNINNCDLERDILYVPFSLVNIEDYKDQISDFSFIEDIYPASHVQMGMLLESDLDNNGTYRDVFNYLVKAKFDKRKFLSVWKNLVNKHELLRASFVLNDDNGWNAIIYKNIEIDYQIYKNHDEKKLIENERLQRFNYSNPGLFKLIINNLDSKFNFIFVVHHAIMDGWSVASLINEFIQGYIYNKVITKDIKIRYGDFVKNELAALNNQNNKEFFKGYLSNVNISSINWKFDTEKAKNSLYISSFNLSKEQVKTVHAIAKDLKIGVDNIFLLVYLKTLAFFTNSSEVTVGLVVNNRPEKEDGDKLLGLFLNTIPLRFKCNNFSSNASNFNELLNLFSDKLKLQKYKHLPYGEIKSLFKQDLYVFEYNFAHFHIMDNSAQDLDTTDMAYMRTNIPFTLDVWQQGDSGFFLFMTVHDNFISKEFLDYFMSYYQKYLTETLYNSNSTLSLTKEDYHKIMSWNNNEIVYPSKKTLHQLFEEQATKTLDKIAVIDSAIGKEYSYKQLLEESNLLSKYVGYFNSKFKVNRESNKVSSINESNSKQDVNLSKHLLIQQVQGALIGVLCAKGYNQVVSTLAIMKAGYGYLPLNVDWPINRINQVLEEGNVELLLVSKSILQQEQIREVLSSKYHLLIVEEILEEINKNIKLKSQLNQFNLAKVTENDIAYVIFTSGSTGKPKGVTISHRGATNTIYAVNERFNIRQKDKVIALSELSFDLSVYDIFGILSVGGTIVFPEQDKSKDPRHWLQLIDKYKITIWNTVPQLADLLIEEVTSDISIINSNIASLRLFLLSGDWIPTNLPKKIRGQCPNAIIMSLGGATEGSIWSVWYEINQLNEEWDSVPYGMAMPNQKIYILNQLNDHCPIGVIGEIYIGGIGVALNYWRDEVKTASSFINHTELGRLYKTADFGRWNKTGYVEFIGRKDDQVKINGYRIELGEINSYLQSYLGVKQSIVLTKEFYNKNNPNDNKYLVGYYSADYPINEEDIFNYLKNCLPEYMVPSVLVYLKNLPLTINGKLDREALPEPTKFTNKNNYIAPRNAFESQICKIWAELLSLSEDQIGMDDNFFKLGGNSILSIRLISKLNRELATNINVAAVFNNDTVSKLVHYLENNAEVNIKKIEYEF